MISSEVQRTLVKSPPELWAEISDPDALARHLGEFGDIRITRVEPEQKVEWKAGETSGTIVIKPSGWGTKVKLTVSHEAPPADALDAPEALGALDPPEALDALNAPEARDEPDVLDALTPTDTAAEPELTADAHAGPSSDAPGAGVRAEHRAPATPEEQIASEPPVAPEPEHGIEPQLDAGLEPEPLADADLKAAWDGQPFEPAPDPPLPLEPRRGFFARLFGRFRDEPVDGPPILGEYLDSPDDLVAGERSHATPDAADAWAEWAAPPSPPASLEPESEPAPEAEPEHGPVFEPLAVAEAGPGPTAQTHAEPTAQTHAELVAEAVAEPIAELQLSSEQEPEQLPDQQVKDISAEIRAAEEVAAEEVATEAVAAVLTGVLDRLGAAHHRPFSRA